MSWTTAGVAAAPSATARVSVYAPPVRPDRQLARVAFDSLLRRKESITAEVVWAHHPGEGRLEVRADGLRVHPAISVLSRGDRDALAPVLDAVRASLEPHPQLAWIEEDRIASEEGEVTLDSHGAELAAPARLDDDRRYISAGERQGWFLYELVRRLQPAAILELGTAYGIGTLYLAAAGDTPIVTVEGDPVRRDAAARLFERRQVADRVDSLVGWFPDSLPEAFGRLRAPLGLVFEDGPHTAEVTKPTFDAVVERLEPGGIAVIDDVYHPAGNEAAWRQIEQHPLVAASAEITGRQGVVVRR